jgi:hypothetical protein
MGTDKKAPLGVAFVLIDGHPRFPYGSMVSGMVVKGLPPALGCERD